jgi:tRNA-specific 2-thiouridylase
LREYEAGRTPNPDILCNTEIKFKAFLDHAISLGADAIATGHYARIAEKDGFFQLLKASDETKDQSYFLHRLNQRQLSKALFPLGAMLKSQVRQIAHQHKLSNHAKKDSTGICFIGERPFREFLNRYLPVIPGKMVTPEGKVMGQHMGLSFYTLGQRQGLGIGGGKDSNGEPWFVAGKDKDANRLIVVQGHNHPDLLSHHLEAMEMHWISGHEPATTLPYAAKTRYRQTDAACNLAIQHGNIARFSFAEPQWAVTPGQSVVVYDGEICLGGGIITGNSSIQINLTDPQ